VSNAGTGTRMLLRTPFLTEAASPEKLFVRDEERKISVRVVLLVPAA